MIRTCGADNNAPMARTIAGVEERTHRAERPERMMSTKTTWEAVKKYADEIRWESATKPGGREAKRANFDLLFSVSGSDDLGLRSHSIAAGLAEQADGTWKYGARSRYLPNGASKYPIVVSGSATNHAEALQAMLGNLVAAAEEFAKEQGSQASRQFKPVTLSLNGAQR